MNQGNKKGISKEELLKAIDGSAGIVNTIANRLNCHWKTAKSHIEKHPEALELMQAEKEKNIDKAESVIMQALDDMDIQTAKWYLATIGKARGYAENSNNVTIHVEKPEQLIIEGIEPKCEKITDS
jgi:hypothetical protein